MSDELHTEEGNNGDLAKIEKKLTKVDPKIFEGIAKQKNNK